jgi:hypothetical protein
MNLPSRPYPASRRAPRRGIALIFVLGCLAMIVIAAISFASFMKVERLVAGQSLELSRARQAAMAGLERALDRLNRGAGAPNFVYNLSGSVTNYWPSAYVYYLPGTDARFRMPSGGMGRDGSMTFLCTDQTTGLPANIAPDYFTADLLLNTPPTPSRTTGAAVSIIANASGRIDIGALRATPARNLAGGMDASGLLSAIGGPTQTQIATSSRQNTMLEYFTMPEVRYIGGVSSKLTGTKENYFTFFEQACQQYRSSVSGAFTNCVYVGTAMPVTLPADANYRLSLADALLVAGVPVAAVPSATFNLVDYLDNDFLPASNDPTQFCGEPIPLINEINLQSTRTDTSSNLVTKCTIRVELNYPFLGATPPVPPQANSNRYALRATISSPDGTSSYTPTNVTIVKPSGASGPWTFPTDEYTVVTLASDVEIRSPSGTGAVRVQITLDMLELGSNVVVDRVGTAAAPIQFSPSVTDYNWSREVRDGRFNFLATEWATAVQNGTLNAMNTTVAGNATAIAEYPYYVRNAPMFSAVELGYVALGNIPWQSLALVEDTSLTALGNPTVHRVLDTFTVHLGQEFDGRPVAAGTLAARAGRAGPLVRGLINANTDKPEVLAAAMMNGVVGERFPGIPPVPRPSTGAVPRRLEHWWSTLGKRIPLRATPSIANRMLAKSIVPQVRPSGFSLARSHGPKVVKRASCASSWTCATSEETPSSCSFAATGWWTTVRPTARRSSGAMS